MADALSVLLKDSTNRRIFEQESLILSASQTIYDIMNSLDVSKAQLAQKLGVSKAYITQCLDSPKNFTIRTLADFAWALDHKVNITFNPADTFTMSSFLRKENVKYEDAYFTFNVLSTTVRSAEPAEESILDAEELDLAA